MGRVVDAVKDAREFLFTSSLKKEVVDDDVPLPLGRREGARILTLFRIITWRCPSLVEETAA